MFRSTVFTQETLSNQNISIKIIARYFLKIRIKHTKYCNPSTLSSACVRVLVPRSISLFLSLCRCIALSLSLIISVFRSLRPTSVPVFANKDEKILQIQTKYCISQYIWVRLAHTVQKFIRRPCMHSFLKSTLSALCCLSMYYMTVILKKKMQKKKRQ